MAFDRFAHRQVGCQSQTDWQSTRGLCLACLGDRGFAEWGFYPITGNDLSRCDLSTRLMKM